MKNLSPDTIEMIDLYVETSRLPRLVVTAFVVAGIEPPDRATVDRIGYTAAQSKLFTPFLTASDPAMA